MLFKNVLVPYDESEHAKSALHIALGMVGDDPTATVHVLAIVATGAFTSPTLTGNAFDDLSYLSDPDRMRERIEEVPLGHLCAPEDVAAAVAFLASDEASFLNGVQLPVDGGTVCD